MKWLLSIALLFLCSSGVLADEISYGGDGCPEGTASTFIDENGDAIINLSTYILKKEGFGLERITCNIAWAFSVPPGYAIAASTAQVIGHLDLKDNSQAQFKAENFIAGSTGEKYSRTVDEPQNNLVEYAVPGQQNPALCGNSGILRLNTSISLNARNAEASIYEIQTIKIKKPLLIKCEGAPERYYNNSGRHCRKYSRTSG